MWHKLKLGIILLFLMAASGGNALPVRYNQLGQRPTTTEMSCRSSSSVPPTTYDPMEPYTERTTSPPDFEYALLGQDPKDQHWYRVSLTPTKNQTGYRAQFATRKQPPFDDRMAHRHDKTIGELLDWLERSEERNLLQVYRDLLAEEQRKPLDNAIESTNNLRLRKNSNQERELQLVGEEEEETTPQCQHKVQMT